MIEKFNDPKKKRCIIFLDVFPMFFFGQKNILIWDFIKFCASHHYIQHEPYDINTFIPLQACLSEMNNHLSK
jgi:hypothetical protein